MSQITTHILDTAIGKPASEVAIVLEYKNEDDWQYLAEGRTDDNGRISNLLPTEFALLEGEYRMRFNIKDYFTKQSQISFYPHVDIVFCISESQTSEHFHIPLLISPFGYSTYRGS